VEAPEGKEIDSPQQWIILLKIFSWVYNGKMIHELWTRIDKMRGAKTALLAVALLLAYFPVLFVSQTVSPDAKFILGIFENTDSLASYIHKLFTLQTFDVQPIRDLSLFIDWEIFYQIGLNTFIWQNCLWWLLSCLVIQKILQEKEDRETSYFLTLLYAVYPLFCTSLSWSMARKHILCFFFILLATYEIMKWVQGRGKGWKITLYYFLAVFSQPIGILWPFWAFAFLHDKRAHKKFSVQWLGLGIVFLLVFVVNYLYYQKSEVFTAIFQSKTGEAFEIADKVLALGHYIYQLFFPYYQTFYYDLGHWSIWIGLLFLPICYLTYSSFKLPKKNLFLWSLFAALPLIVVLNTPKTKSDTYLLLPSFAVLMLISGLPQKFPLLRKLGLPLFLIWILLSHLESRNWTDNLRFARDHNFYRRPTCTSALRYVRMAYHLLIKADVEALTFLKDNQCFASYTAYEALENVFLQAESIYFDDTTSLEKRIEALEQLSRVHWYPDLLLSSLYLRAGRKEEAASHLHHISEVVKPTDASYVPLLEKDIIPYCTLNPSPDCSKLISYFHTKKKLPYL
jgi:hypothetical protein